jgi:hypothetical protein
VETRFFWRSRYLADEPIKVAFQDSGRHYGEVIDYLRRQERLLLQFLGGGAVPHQ